MPNEQDAKPDFHLSLGDGQVPSAASTSQTVGGSGAVPTVQDRPQEWDHKDEWRKSGKGFMVVISRHNGREDFDEGPNRWAVYAYIYPKHPHFAAFDGPHMWQLAASCLPLHGYPSLLEYPMYEGKITSVKVGADYHHLHDDFTHYATPEEAAEVFNDAQALFDWLQRMALAMDAAPGIVDSAPCEAASAPGGQQVQAFDAVKVRALYDAVNEMMAPLGAYGTICARDDRVQAVMNALHDIDGGTPLPIECTCKAADMPFGRCCKAAKE